MLKCPLSVIFSSPVDTVGLHAYTVVSVFSVKLFLPHTVLLICGHSVMLRLNIFEFKLYFFLLF